MYLTRSTSRAVLVMLALTLNVGCKSAPPNISPEATRDFHKTQVIKGLDLLRDFAIGAEAQEPKVLSTATTRTVVTVHQSALRIIQSSDTGWVAAVSTALDEGLAQVPQADRPKIAPYLALVKTILVEVTR